MGMGERGTGGEGEGKKVRKEKNVFTHATILHTT